MFQFRLDRTVGQTKLKQVNIKSFAANRTTILKGLKNPLKTPLEDYSTFCEGKGKDKWLFNRSVFRSFAGGWDSTEQVTSGQQSLFRLALLRATMENCNAYPDGKCLRYKRLKSYKCFNVESLTSQFEAYCDMMEEDLEAAPIQKGLSKIVRMDSRTLSEYKDARKFDLCITSPPYLNTFDYSDVYRPELFLSGFVANNQELMKIRLKTLRSHVQANWERPTRNDFGVLYSKILKEVEAKKDDLWSNRIPAMIQAYFEDLERLLIALKSKANTNATLKIVVATSAYAGVIVPVDLIIADIAENTGWQLEKVQTIRRLRSSAQLWKHENLHDTAQELRESIVILKSA
ncbi:MAG: hypothetical protein PHV33_00250 [Elusimicrobiales bacterium]|nr:hypothetical protein [Elusimicrobiales bacterium]